MNAFETPVPAASVSRLSSVTSIVVGPVSASLPLGQLATTAHSGPPANGMVTMQNAESGVSLQVGEGFFLDLGERGWNVRIGDPTRLSLVSDPAAPAASQGYFQALQAGETKLYATSGPPARGAKPPGLMPTLFLEIKVTILP